MFVCLLCFFICLFALTVQSICRFFFSPSHSIWSYNPFSCTWIMFCLFVIVSLLLANYEDSKFVGEKNKRSHDFKSNELSNIFFYLHPARLDSSWILYVQCTFFLSFGKFNDEFECVCVCSCRHIYISTYVACVYTFNTEHIQGTIAIFKWIKNMQASELLSWPKWN